MRQLIEPRHYGSEIPGERRSAEEEYYAPIIKATLAKLKRNIFILSRYDRGTEMAAEDADMILDYEHGNYLTNIK